MNWLLTVVLCVLLVEVVIRLPFLRVLRELEGILRKAMRVVRARSVSDHWKEKAVPAYAGRMFTATLKLAVLLLAVGTLALALIWLFDRLSASYDRFIVGWAGILFSILVASTYAVLRRRLG